MRGANGKKKWIFIVASLSLVFVAGVLYLDYQADQLMGLASGDIIEVLETHVIEIPEETVSEKAIDVNDLPQQDNENASASNNQSGSSIEQVPPPAAPPQKPMPAPSNNETDQASETTTEIDAEEATLFEKAQAYKLASSKLSAKEINALIQWSQDGFTETEKESAKSLFYSRFSEEEQQWILGLFKKYN